MRRDRSGPDSPPLAPATELSAVQARYARRQGDEQRYSLMNRAVMLADMLSRSGMGELKQLNLVEVGCGTGMNLVELLRMGFTPARLHGIELLPLSAERARAVLPPAVRLTVGDAAAAGSTIPPASQDIVYQATVFSSLLDPEFQARLARVMWDWVRPGGGVLWYDFTVDNPRNPDVRGVPLARVRALFPDGRPHARRITLAPPLGRMAARLHPLCYTTLNLFSFLRTHQVVWIQKMNS